MTQPQPDEVILVYEEVAETLQVIEAEAAPLLEVIEEVTEIVEVQVPGMQGPAHIGDSSYPVYIGTEPPLNTQLLWLDTSEA